MAICDTCGNDYWMAFEVRTVSGQVYTFDCFECAATKLAPVCEHCSCRILGHGVEVEGRFYCCAHCARSVDERLGERIRDAVGAHPG
ncbi:phage terminase large subunit GpA-like protein [Actinokineospora baliensis]|uniref:Prokaryotic metallothionein n=1 Tax=Actinokineospora baliensis TaxID=547056 RepID=UPI001956C6D8|nr:Prokaryotic metallothionein [Actinokineospora baliensis]MBM7770187.1 phage terminase large subunit GpA-like protein [Actinokineospora baliensis]